MCTWENIDLWEHRPEETQSWGNTDLRELREHRPEGTQSWGNTDLGERRHEGTQT